MTKASDRSEPQQSHFAVVVLCGGKSTRMGFPKWKLPFGSESMLERVLRISRKISQTQIVVAARDQRLGDFPERVKLTLDERPERGPLQGIHAGLSALPEDVDAAFVTSCDVPMLKPEFIQRLFDLLTPTTQIVVPFEDRFMHPLAAVYRRGVLPVVTRLLEQDRLRPVFLFDQVETRRVHVDELREADAELASLENLNDPASYLEAVRQTGFDVADIPHDITESLKRTP